MGNEYTVKQPNGKYAIYSTSCDQFVSIDLTEEDLLKIRTESIHAEYQKLLKGAKEEITKQISGANNPPDDDRATWEGAYGSAAYWNEQCGSGKAIIDYLHKQDWFKEWLQAIED